jgi:O-antigen ligase
LALFTFLHFISITWSPDPAAGWKSAESKTGYLILPLILCSSPITDRQFKNIMLFFSWSITVALVYCLISAFFLYNDTGSPNVFFYHELLEPIRHHAVYFSVYVFSSIVFLIFKIFPKQKTSALKSAVTAWVVFLLIFIILLSSKMVLFILGLFLTGWWIYRLITHKKWTNFWIPLAVMTVLLTLFISFDNPVKRRFTNLLEGNANVFYQEKFHPSDYFNGIQFRLLLWRVTYLVLNEERAWVKGVSPAASQVLLQKQYRDLNIYPGDQKTNNGYFDYNCHNQFLQTTLQLGLIGLMLLILVIINFTRLALKIRDPSLSAILTVTLFFFFTESVLERQYGMVLVALIPFLFLRSDLHTKKNILS